MGTAKLILDGTEHELPLVVGSESEVGIDIAQLRAQTGAITLDEGYGNTGACKSAITFIDGEQGILRYRGIPIEELAEARFTEVAYLLVYGVLPNAAELAVWREQLTRHSLLHEDMKKFFEGFPASAHPMAILSAMVASLSTYYPDDQDLDLNIVRLLAKAKTIAAFSYKKSIGQPFMYPLNRLSYSENFLQMMFACRPSPTWSRPGRRPRAQPAARPPRRPRAELLDLDRAHGRLVGRQPVRGDFGRHLRPVGPAARRRQPGGDRDARADRRRRRRLPEVRGDGQGQVDGLQADGLRPPRLQELRSPLADPQGRRRRGARRARRATIRCSRSPRVSRRSPSPTTTSSSASSIRTSTSTPASSTAPWASRPTCSP
jgi:hypothetical protein